MGLDAPAGPSERRKGETLSFLRQLGYEDGVQVALCGWLLGCFFICALFVNYCRAKPVINELLELQQGAEVKP
jgi:hypothetical protein